MNPLPVPLMACFEMVALMRKAGPEASEASITHLRAQCTTPEAQWSPQVWWLLGTADNAAMRQQAMLNDQRQPVTPNEHARRVGAAFSFGLPGLLNRRANEADSEAQLADAWVKRFDFPILPDSPLARGLDKHKTLLPAWRRRKRHENMTNKLSSLFHTPGEGKLEESLMGVRALPKDFPQRLVDDLVGAALKATRWPLVEALLPRKPSSQALGDGLLDVAVSNPREDFDAQALFKAMLAAGADANPPTPGGFFLTKSGCPDWAWEAVKHTLDAQRCLDGWGKDYNISSDDPVMRVRLDELMCRLPAEAQFVWKQAWMSWPPSHRPRGAQRELDASLTLAAKAVTRPRM